MIKNMLLNDNDDSATKQKSSYYFCFVCKMLMK